MADQMMMGGDTPDQGAGDDTSAGYCIEIRVTADGKMSVGVEPLAEEQDEEGGNAENYQPVGSIKEAMQKVMEIYQNDGAQDTSDDDFNAGYGGGKSPAAPIREMNDMDM